MREWAGLRLALTTLTVAPLAPGTVDRRRAGQAMTWAPVVGALVGGVAAVVVVTVRVAISGGYGDFLAATLGVATLAVLTRGLHLDGLADTVDGWGVHGRERALDVMKRPDVGAFGVVAIVLALGLQVSSLTTLAELEHATRALVLACATGRIAITVACRRGVPAARPGGLGATVAGSVPAVVPLLWTAVALGGAAVWGWLDDDGGRLQAAAQVAAVAAGVGAAWWLTARTVRRLGGITGDVLGAVNEIAVTVTLLVSVVGAGHGVEAVDVPGFALR